MKRVIRLGFLFGLLLAAGGALHVASPPLSAQEAPRPAPSPDARTTIEAELDRLKGQLDIVARALTRENLSEAELAANRQTVERIVQRIAVMIEDQRPKVEALAAQLEKLGPNPAANMPPESAEIARQRATLESAREQADALLRIAQTLSVRATQIATTISDRRRALFTRALFERTFSIASPWLWGAVFAALPQEIRALRQSLGDWADRVSEEARAGNWPAILFALLLAIGMVGPLRSLTRRFDPRDRRQAEPEPVQKIGAALLAAVINGGLPLLAAGLIYALLDGAQALPVRLAPVASAVIFGAAAIAVFNALADAFFAPGRSAWRISQVTDRQAERVCRTVFACALVFYAGKVMASLDQAIASSLTVSVAVKALFAGAFVLTLLRYLHRFGSEAEQDNECLGPYVPSVAELIGPVRVFLILVAVLALLALIAGYIAFAAFLVDQIAWLTLIGFLFVLLARFADLSIASALTGEGRINRVLTTSMGLRHRSLEQGAVLLSGVSRLALVVAALLFALAPWGIQSEDIFSSAKAALFGIRIGDVTISISSIIVALIVFALFILGTRGLQRWLDEKFLPRTDLDSGIRNSIRTAVGYIGFCLAAAVAISSVGFSLDRIAIVAGALSVGIGFGLQSIVNNFVSGLILLWERSIKVGDWIIVGEEQGFVRRINVRSTEIETFDRTTVIVPNSNLISGIVKNKVHNDRTGRVSVSIAVPRNSDPEVARVLLEEAALTHADVLREPKPRAFFRKITDTTLEFELYAFIADVETGGRIASDLHFAVHAALVAKNLAHPITRPAEPIPPPKSKTASP